MPTETFAYGTSLVVQWLRFRASMARVAGSIPGQGPRLQEKKKIKTSACPSSEGMPL